MILDILCNTPIWVYALLLLLTWLGVCQLRAREVPVCRIWRMPAIFIIWGLLGLLMHNTAGIIGTAPWLIAAVVGAFAGSARPNTLVIDHARDRVMRPASVLPLLRNLSVFAAHYALNVAAAWHPGRHGIMQVDMAISGLFAGYFAGWLMRFFQHHRKSAGLPATPLPARP